MAYLRHRPHNYFCPVAKERISKYWTEQITHVGQDEVIPVRLNVE